MAGGISIMRNVLALIWLLVITGGAMVPGGCFCQLGLAFAKRRRLANAKAGRLDVPSAAPLTGRGGLTFHARAKRVLLERSASLITQHPHPVVLGAPRRFANILSYRGS